MVEPTTLLMVSHGHPDHVRGGGEISAYSLHQRLEHYPDFRSVFFARHGQPELTHGGTPFSGNGREREILFYSSTPDWFRFSQPDKPRIWRDFREVLTLIKPRIVHFHHYLHLGIELIREVRNFDPTIRIVLTLHEYFGICHHHGQMVKAQDQSLCYRASPTDCARCFPQYSPQDFYLREQFIKSHFTLVDQFVCPSRFLLERYVEWGLPRERMCVIENLLAGSNVAPPTPSEHPSDRVRLAFFGQINYFKGVDLLLDAVEQLRPEIRAELQVEINGSGLDQQSQALRRQISRQVETLADAVQMRGPYHPSELEALMRATDWVVVPSRWWENSPVVILEARRFGVPVICSNIGGMAEKVAHGQNGLHFLAGRASSLAQQITRIVLNRDEQPHFAKRMQLSFQQEQVEADYVGLYRTLAGMAGLPVARQAA